MDHANASPNIEWRFHAFVWWKFYPGTGGVPHHLVTHREGGVRPGTGAIVSTDRRFLACGASTNLR